MGWSTVAQVGFLLVPVAAAGRSDLALPSLLFYPAAYALTNVAAFAVTATIPDHRELGAYRGLASARPGLALALLVALLGLVGTPPTAVFVGKLATATAVWDGGHGWLALIVMINSLLSLFYYPPRLGPAFARPTVAYRVNKGGNAVHHLRRLGHLDELSMLFSLRCERGSTRTGARCDEQCDVPVPTPGSPRSGGAPRLAHRRARTRGAQRDGAGDRAPVARGRRGLRTDDVSVADPDRATRPGLRDDPLLGPPAHGDVATAFEYNLFGPPGMAVAAGIVVYTAVALMRRRRPERLLDLVSPKLVLGLVAVWLGYSVVRMVSIGMGQEYFALVVS
ncbi:proton-conducting transporter membrane subunit [Janibacter limosus]|uniref:Uncharacterized protein n=1 Tax=Janibacter limosus TaxID=53458 RepID=A0AC61U8Q8_9MICO|nr:proton-conducting transporter membrane subunit [Janibacter limosus]UUZ46457.1 proton-conducting transporter membrane subunit [Janibacter limosus]